MGVSLTTTFKMVDEMSARFDRIYNSGTSAIDQWERAGQIADTSFGRATSGVVRTAQSIDDLNQSMGDYELSSNGLVEIGYMSEEALNAQTAAADEAANSINDYGNQSESAGQQAEMFGNRSVNAIQELSQVLAAAGIIAGLKAIYDGFMECSEIAATFETTTAKVATVANTSQVSMDQISGEIIALSNDTGDAVAGLSDAVYQAISASIDTADAVEFAGTATRLATGGFTEAATAVDVLTTAINAYGLESEDALRISDMLVTTQNLGKTTVNELAMSVGKVIPLASAYNVEMDNLSTAYAQLTKNGIATAESGTYLKAMLSELGNSSSAVATTLRDETGQSFAMLMEQGYSLGDVMDVLGDSVDSDATKFNELWSSTEAGIGALSLFNAGAEDFNHVLGQMQNSAGATAKAYSIMNDTTADAHEDMINAMTNMEMVVGKQLNPVLKELYNVGTDAFVWMGDFLEENPAITAALSGLVTGTTIFVGVFTAYVAIKKVSTAISAAHTAVQAAETSATIAQTSAQTALNIAMNANPVFLIVTGVVALTAAVATFVAILASQETEYDTWTASTKSQYDELQSLNEEYEKACDLFGETDERALNLRYQMDDLNASFEANKKIVEDFVAECDALQESHSNLMQSYEQNTASIKDEEIGTLALINKLEELGSQSSLAAGEQEQMEAIIAQLNKELPGLALSYDDVTSSIDATTEAFKQAAQAQADMELKSESERVFIDALKQEKLLEAKVAEAKFNLDAERARLGMYYDEVYGQWTNGSYTEESPWASWTTDIDDYVREYDELIIVQEENSAQLEKIRQQYSDMERAIEEATKAPASYEDAMKSAIEGIQSEMDGLIAKYDEAYQAARSSIDSTIGLFDMMKTETELSVADMSKALESQAEFLAAYTENLRKASEYGLDNSLISSLSDGSTESAGQLDAIISKIEGLGVTTANAAGFVSDFNASFAEVQTAKDEFAATVADMETDFTHTLDKMEEDLAKAIDNMTMESEAATAAKDTITAYIDAIKSQQDDAVSAAEAVAKATADALNSTYNGGTGEVTSALPVKKKYAIGTASASPGIALVGEYGPELVNFNGGEVVYTADETEKILTQAKEPYIISVPENFGMPPAADKTSGEVSEKKITLEIAGSGEISVDSSMNEEQVVTLLYANIKPVLLGIIKQEVYEEGDRSYEY